MSKSEKRLAAGLGAVSLVYIVYLVIWPAISGPVVSEQGKLTSAQKALEAETTKVDLALARIQSMQLNKEQSLSSNVSEASLGYEQWLSDLAENVVKFRGAKVSRETTSPSRDNSYVAIKIRVAGQGTMKQLREFLYRFHRANVLHQISSLTVEAIDNSSNPLLDVVIMADGLSLRDAPVKGPTLFPRSEVVAIEDDPDHRVVVADGTAGWSNQAPFEIRIDDRYLTVLERVHQIWEVKGTGQKAEAGAVVTLVEKTSATSAPTAGVEKTADKPSTETTAKPKNKSPAPKAVTTKLAKAWDGQSKSMVVAVPEGFAPGRIQIRIGEAVLDVVSRREVWRIDDQKFRASTGTIVEASPSHPNFKDVTLEDFNSLLELNPFAKIRTLPPNFLLTGERRLERGNTAVLTPIVQNLGPNAAQPKFEILSQLPAGMTFADGKLNWNPPADMEPGDFDVKIRATSDALEKPLEDTFKVSLTVTRKNDAPLLWPPEGQVVGVLGQLVKFQVTGSDTETPAEDLRFRAGDGFPEGGTVNAVTGEVTWMPTVDTQPGPVQFPVTVVDNGDPQQSTTTTVTVNLEEDRAIFTYLTASVAADDRRQAWLYDRSSNKRVIVQEGDAFKFAGFDALILSIGRDFILMQQDRDTLRVDIGDSLRQAVVIATAPAPEPDTSVEGTPTTGTETPAGTTSPTSPNPASTEAELDALLKGLEEAEAGTKPADGAKPTEVPKPAETSQPTDPDATSPAKPAVDTTKPDNTAPKTDGAAPPENPKPTEEDLEALLKALEEDTAPKPTEEKKPADEPKPAEAAEKPEVKPAPAEKKPEPADGTN